MASSEKIYGLLGRNLSHSFSKEIHEKLGAYNFFMWEREPEDIPSFFEKREFDGLMITIPYKERVLEYLDSMSPEVKALNCCNLILKDEGRLKGFNTDVYGFKYMVKRAGISIEDEKVLVLGDGATSRTVIHCLKEENPKEILQAKRKGPFAVKDNVKGLTYEDDFKDAAIVINTTPVGMFPKTGEALVDLWQFPKAEGVLDVIYNPLYSKLLLDAKDRGIKFSNGLPMLIAQAMKAGEIFLNGKMPEGRTKEEWIERILKEEQSRLKNFVFIGMPGSGKTSIGKKTARDLDKVFVDTDELIEEALGKSCEDIIREKGEEFFRAQELVAAKAAGEKTGQVISTGGGMVLQEKAMDYLRQNSEVVYIKRPLEKLDMKGRPLSENMDVLRKLYELRKPLYERYAETVYDNSEDY